MSDKRIIEPGMKKTLYSKAQDYKWDDSCRIFTLSLFFMTLLVITGCGSGDGTKDSTKSTLNTYQISPEVGIVLKLVVSEQSPQSQKAREEEQLQKSLRNGSQTNTSSILYRHSEESLANPVPKYNASCQYEGYETYIPENVDNNTMRETFDYDWCKKDHPIASHLIWRQNGLYISEETDPDYTGSDPLRDPNFWTRERIYRMKDYTAEEYDKTTGILVNHTYYPEYYRRSSEEFSQVPGFEYYFPYGYPSRTILEISGTGSDVNPRGTPNNPDDDYLYEAVYDNYFSDESNLDHHYDVKTGSGYSGLSKSIDNGYMKVSREDRMIGKRYSFGALYENYANEAYRVDVNDNGILDKADATYYSIDGAIIPDSCSGKKFVIKTSLSLYQPFASPCPLEGELVVSSGEREVTLRFLENQTVEVDINSDGIVDDTVSCQAVTDSDFCTQ